MGDERAIEMIGRIDRALARIEGAVSRRAAPSPDDGSAAALEEAHRALRSRVEAAIVQIDGLLASDGAG